jgi:hypothetical protein
VDLNVIGQASFRGASALVAVNLTSNSKLSSIQQDAFQDCSALEVVLLPSISGAGYVERGNYLGPGAFNNCSKIEPTNVDWGNSGNDICDTFEHMYKNYSGTNNNQSVPFPFDFECPPSKIKHHYSLEGATCSTAAPSLTAANCYATIDASRNATNCTVTLNESKVGTGMVSWFVQNATRAIGFVLDVDDDNDEEEETQPTFVTHICII